ncbi:magnesium/cobalt transporter CorA [Methanofollis aquaemaris]|uniref:Magnesium transport protein CorA n=1 Tax=Methanofollis aquaemaris TaxID=126734 RepID=A0A8A3S9C4_9EURY|nr:magnesium/cobalt transporter CorA [Methanofollis aquaemaris]QSZ68204.1 magnesium/cobalt transporter CorA [Methanofollis aquaemaris]
MALTGRKRSEKAGLPPGSLVYVGDTGQEATGIDIIDYTWDEIREETGVDAGDLPPYLEKESITWIDVTGLGDIAAIETIGEIFGLHPLVLEDVLNTEQRPKMEDYGETIAIILKWIGYQAGDTLVDEQISLVLGKNYVISFQERPLNVFEPVRTRIRGGAWRARRLGADYLAYALVDAVVDSYFAAMETFGEKIEAVDNALIEDPDADAIRAIQKVRRELLYLRRQIWPLREVVSSMERTESPLFADQTGVYLRDVYDHIVQVIEALETYRDMSAGMLDIYLSSTSNRMNEVMKVLTIIATIFIPLSFITGIFGMNFRFMPELAWEFGYYACLGLMAAVAIGMLAYFRKKKWI